MRDPSLLHLLPLALLIGATSGIAAPQGGPDAVDARIARNVSNAAPPRPEPLFAASAPATGDASAKSQADADLASRDTSSKSKLRVDRENLKGKSAAPALQKGMSPANYDRSIQMGSDKDHVQQATSLKIYLKPPPEPR